MLTKVEVDNLQGSTLSLPLEDSSNGYVVKGIEGLDPVKATITTSPFAQLDGSTYQGARRENRNILMKVGLEPNWATQSVRVLRRDIYAYFMPKTNLLLRFFNDDVLYATISGQVEFCEASPFAKDPEVIASILCFDPNFDFASATQVTGNSVSTTTEQTIYNSGTVEAGFVFKLMVNRVLPSFTIYNRRPNGDVYSMDVTYAFVAGDVVTISTLPRNKYITLTRAGTTTPILHTVSPLSKWMPLFSGNNFFRVQATGAAIPWTIDYRAKLGGL